MPTFYKIVFSKNSPVSSGERDSEGPRGRGRSGVFVSAGCHKGRELPGGQLWLQEHLASSLSSQSQELLQPYRREPEKESASSELEVSSEESLLVHSGLKAKVAGGLSKQM